MKTKRRVGSTAEAGRSAPPPGLIKGPISRPRAEPDFRTLFESAPGLYLVLEPDAPRYTVVAASDAYLRATMRTREEMLGRGLFEVWPPDPADPQSTAVDSTAASLKRVVRTCAADTMAVQRHDIHRPAGEGGASEKRFWSPANSPVFGRDGGLTYIIHHMEDVTESVRVGEANRDALLEEEQRSRDLFESAPDGIFIANPDGRYTDVNASGCRLLGYSREELVGRSIVDFVSPDELPRQAALKRRILEGGMEVSEWRLQRKDGTYVPVELSSNALPNGHLRAFVRDITERSAAEKALRLSEAMFSGIVSCSVDAIISIDEAQRITMFNEGAERIFGYAKAEILGSPLEALIPERFRLIHREHMKGFAEGKEKARLMGTRRTAIYGLRKNGEEFPADAAISKLEVGSERVFTVSLRDVSERKRTEDEDRLLAEVGKILVTAGADYQGLLTGVANLIVRNIADWCSVDIVQEGEVRRLKVVHADPALTAICDALARYPGHHKRSSPVSNVVDTERSVLMSEVPPEYLDARAENAEHLRLMRALDPGSFIVVPLIARGKTLGMLGLGASRASRRYGPQDVRLVEVLANRVAMAVDNARLYEALERAIRARDEVLGIVAHDLRNPLNAIVLNAQALRRLGDETELSERIHRAAMRMNRLIQDLLDVARLDAGQRLSITQDAVPTASVLREAAEQQRAAISASNRRLNVDTARVPPSVWADRTRLLQVFDNLLGNAIKFARQRITVGAATKDAEVLFWVADDGTGVSAENLPRLFDRFWQATRADHRGAGLGLSIAKGIVDGHGGRMWVESEVGAGTTFYFTLPVAPRAEAPSAERGTPCISGAAADHGASMHSDGGCSRTALPRGWDVAVALLACSTQWSSRRPNSGPKATPPARLG